MTVFNGAFLPTGAFAVNWIFWWMGVFSFVTNTAVIKTSLVTHLQAFSIMSQSGVANGLPLAKVTALVDLSELSHFKQTNKMPCVMVEELDQRLYFYRVSQQQSKNLNFSMFTNHGSLRFTFTFFGHQVFTSRKVSWSVVYINIILQT